MLDQLLLQYTARLLSPLRIFCLVSLIVVSMRSFFFSFNKEQEIIFKQFRPKKE